ncbi:MAG: methionine aminotransferase [Bacteroidota bacterium]
MNLDRLPVSKLPQVGTTIFTVMSALAHEHGAINLSQGFPDFGGDHRLIEWVHQAMLAGHNQYAPMPGLPALREQVASLQQQLYGATYDPDTEVTITSGATEALAVALATFIHPGDEVIIFEPAYDAYQPNIELHGGVARAIPLSLPDYRIDWDRVRESLTPQTRAIIINSPHNPTGAVLTQEDLETLAQLLAEFPQLMLIGDEVYEHIIFDGQSHLSLSGHPALKPRSLVISSFGKTLHTTGWKVGYLLAPAALAQEFRKVHQFTVFSVPTPFQHALARYLREGQAEILGLKQFYQAKRDLFLDLMAESRFRPIASQGTYFQLMGYEGISDLPEDEFARWLTTEVGVAAIPVSAFYQTSVDNQTVRFCFAKEDETLASAAKKLVKL